MNNLHGEAWTAKEDKYLKLNYLTMSVKDISQVLNRSNSAIYSRAARLGLSKHDGPSTIYRMDNTKIEDNIDKLIKDFKLKYPKCHKKGRCMDCVYMHTKMNNGSRVIPLCVVLEKALKIFREEDLNDA